MLSYPSFGIYPRVGETLPYFMPPRRSYSLQDGWCQFDFAVVVVSVLASNIIWRHNKAQPIFMHVLDCKYAPFPSVPGRHHGLFHDPEPDNVATHEGVEGLTRHQDHPQGPRIAPHAGDAPMVPASIVQCRLRLASVYVRLCEYQSRDDTVAFDAIFAVHAFKVLSVQVACSSAIVFAVVPLFVCM